jgi:plasmid stabilization system protein ParE
MEQLVLAGADADVLETYARLEDAAAGLGERFNERVEEALDRLLSFPQSGPMYMAPYRRLLVMDFPFGVFYSIEGRRIVVQAVLHLRQDPSAIRRRLGLT